MYFLGWIIFSFVAGFVGSDRKIGFFGAFLFSLILSPLVGLIVAFASKSNTEIQYQEEILKTQKQQQTALEQIAQSNEIEQLHNLMTKGILTEEEFNHKKRILLGLNKDGSITTEKINSENKDQSEEVLKIQNPWKGFVR